MKELVNESTFLQFKSVECCLLVLAPSWSKYAEKFLINVTEISTKIPSEIYFIKNESLVADQLEKWYQENSNSISTVEVGLGAGAIILVAQSKVVSYHARCWHLSLAELLMLISNELKKVL